MSRGSGRGQKAAIVAKVKAEKESKKRQRGEERDKKFAICIDDMGEMKQIIKKKLISTILTRASKDKTDPSIKKKLGDKLISLALDFLDELYYNHMMFLLIISDNMLYYIVA